jgi:predicted aldo/keto reductase-like oxidoreductase
MYMGGRAEVLTGNTLSRFPRETYHVATKMSNQNRRLWSYDDSKRMYEQSFERLKVDYIDYYLLHSIGGGMESLKGRFLDNGILDFLLKEREAGRIKHLGFSYHGDVRDFDWLLDRQEEYHWDFVQIQMNFLDWRHASLKQGRRHDADAEYLYGKLEKTGVQAVIMEPLRGGAFGRMASELADQLKAVRPDDSTARWAFRWVGSYPNVLTTLSGMNQMEHLVDNVTTFSPLEACTEAENKLLANIADQMAGFPTIPCTTCAYCMPCPYGVDIPGNFSFYNEAVNNHLLPLPEPTASDYAERQQRFMTDYREALPAESRANQCVDCEACLPKCPQQIRIPNQMGRIVSLLRRQ